MVLLASERVRVLVTGASGYIGKALADTLDAAGHDVLRGARSAPAGTTQPWVGYGDLRGEPDWEPLLAGCEAVVHVAGLAHVPPGGAADRLAHAVNVVATERLARAAAAAGVKRFLFMSSAHVNGTESRDGPLTEDQEPAPDNVYARSKLMAERGVMRIAAEHGMAWTILRPPMVYGPAAPGNFGRLVKLVRSGLPLPLGAARAPKSFIALGNLASATVQALTQSGAANAVFLVADAETVSTADLVRIIASNLGRKARLIPVPESAMRAASRLTGRGRDIARLFDPLVIDSGRIRERLGWTPPLSLADGVRLALARS